MIEMIYHFSYFYFQLCYINSSVTIVGTDTYILNNTQNYSLDIKINATNRLFMKKVPQKHVLFVELCSKLSEIHAFCLIELEVPPHLSINTSLIGLVSPVSL